MIGISIMRDIAEKEQLLLYQSCFKIYTGCVFCFWVRMKKTCYFLFAFNVLLRFICAVGIPLSYKEAYFWEWSLFPSWGYLDHPPMVAWLIWGSSSLVSSPSLLSVRLGALLLGTASLLLIFRLAHRLFDDKALAYRALIIAISFPVLNAVWTFPLPDTPQLFFQLFAWNVLVDIRESGQGVRWALVGALLGLSLLSKVTAILSVLALVIYLIETSHSRFPYNIRHLAWAALFVCVTFAPYLIWNANYQWQGLRLQLWERHFWDYGWSVSKALEYSFEQIVAASPVLFPFMLGSLCLGKQRLPEQWQEPFRFLQWQCGLPLFFFFVVGSCITQTHPHWTALAYPSAAILLAAWWTLAPKERYLRQLPKGLFALQSCMALLLCLAAFAPQLIFWLEPSYLGSSLGRGLVKGQRRILGFPSLSQEIDIRLREEGLGEDTVIWTNSYQLAGPLSFARQGAPVLCLDAFVREQRVMGHAQRYYVSEKELKGRPGLFLDRHNSAEMEDFLRQHFTEVKALPPVTQSFGSETLASHALYRVE